MRNTRPTLSALPLLDLSCSLNRSQLCWLWGGDQGGTELRNIANPARNGTLLAGVSRDGSVVGRAPLFDGGANSYIDMGANLIQAGESCTISWIEQVAPTTPTYGGVCCFFPNGGSQRFLMFREGSGYGRLAWRVGGGAMVVSSTVPTISSGVGLARHFVLRGRNGIESATPSDWDVWVDGALYTQAAGNNLTAQTAQLNYWGWDGADSKWLGWQTNQRLWNRALSDGEIDMLVKNAYAGIEVESFLFPVSGAPPPAAGLYRMLLAF